MYHRGVENGCFIEFKCKYTATEDKLAERKLEPRTQIGTRRAQIKTQVTSIYEGVFTEYIHSKMHY